MKEILKELKDIILYYTGAFATCAVIAGFPSFTAPTLMLITTDNLLDSSGSKKAYNASFVPKMAGLLCGSIFWSVRFLVSLGIISASGPMVALLPVFGTAGIVGILGGKAINKAVNRTEKEGEQEKAQLQDNLAKAKEELERAKEKIKEQKGMIANKQAQIDVLIQATNGTAKEEFKHNIQGMEENDKRR